MKTYVKRYISIVLMIIIISSVSIVSNGDMEINNVILGQDNQPTKSVLESATKSGFDLIQATGDADKITLPNQDSYLTEPTVMFVNSKAKNSINSYLTPWKDKSKIGSFPYHGVKVLVVAEQGDFDCIIFHDNNNKAQAAWVYASELTSAFPGVTQTIGTPSVLQGYHIGDVDSYWSKEKFVGSRQKYTIIDTNVVDCIQFTLDYQLIGRNGARTEQVLGSRKVYIYIDDKDNSGWKEIGEFSYTELDATHVVVNLPEPMDLIAVATIAECAKPDTFIFRQGILDVIVAAN